MDLKELGLKVSQKNCISPTCCLTWLGFDINTQMVITIPQDKLNVDDSIKKASIGTSRQVVIYYVLYSPSKNFYE